MQYHLFPARRSLTIFLVILFVFIIQACMYQNGSDDNQRGQPTIPKTSLATASLAPITETTTRVTDTPTMQATRRSPTHTLPPTATATLKPAPYQWPGYLAVMGFKDGSDIVNQDLFILKVKDTQTLPVLSGSKIFIYEPVTWFPAGDRLVFASYDKQDKDYRHRLSLYDLFANALTEIAPLPKGGALFFEPVVSPDGQQLAFVQQGGPHARIHVMDLINRQSRFVIEGIHPSWVDNQTITFIKPHWDEKMLREIQWGDLYRIQTDGSGLKQLTSNLRVYRNAVSPDGNHVAIYVNDEETGKEGIYLLDPDGGNFNLFRANFGDISWEPNGNSILSAYDCKIYRLPLDRSSYSTLIPLPDGYCYTHAAQQPIP